MSVSFLCDCCDHQADGIGIIGPRTTREDSIAIYLPKDWGLECNKILCPQCKTPTTDRGWLEAAYRILDRHEDYINGVDGDDYRRIELLCQYLKDTRREENGKESEAEGQG